MQQFMVYYSFLWCLLKNFKATSFRVFFFLYFTASRHSLNQIPNKERRLRACLFAETAGNLLIFWGAAEGEGASVDLRFNVLGDFQGSSVCCTGNVSSFAVFSL